jgi:hypothetical protein
MNRSRTATFQAAAPKTITANSRPRTPVARQCTFPATIFADPDGDLKAWDEGRLSLALELYSGYGINLVQVSDATIPWKPI